MVCRAEERFADEIDAGQERGEIATGRPSSKVPGQAVLSDIGVTSQNVSDFRKVRDLGSDKVAEIVDAAVAEGRAPTKGEVLSPLRLLLLRVVLSLWLRLHFPVNSVSGLMLNLG